MTTERTSGEDMLKRILWFVTIWAASVMALWLFAIILRGVLK